MTDLAERLTKVERDQSHPNLKPRDAATLIIVDRSGEVPKVLLGKRHAGLKFMAGKLVFPGGRMEPGDRKMPVASDLDAHAGARLMRAVRRPSLAKARALALAAVRETFEETGLLLGKRVDAVPPVPDGPWKAFAEAGVLPTSISCTSSCAPSRRRAGRAASTRASSPWTSAPSRTASTARSGRTASWSSWSGCRSPRRRNTICRPSRRSRWTNSKSRVARGFGHDLPSPFYRMLNKKFVRAEL